MTSFTKAECIGVLLGIIVIMGACYGISECEKNKPGGNACPIAVFSLEADTLAPGLDYVLAAHKYLSRFPKSKITPIDLYYAADSAYRKYGRYPSLQLALAQGQLESSFGSSSPLNPYNIRSGDGSYHKYTDTREGVLKYHLLMCHTYLTCKSEEELLLNFVSCEGYRYAESPTYEQSIRNQILFINSIIK